MDSPVLSNFSWECRKVLLPLYADISKNFHAMKKLFLILSFSLCLLVSSAASQKPLPVVEIMGNKYYMYESKKGETLFGIARARHWDDSELQRINPQAISPLKKGMKIFYPVADNDGAQSGTAPAVSSESEVKELTHVVGKGENVYSIAQIYNMPVEKIYRFNPSARNGVKVGQVLALQPSPSDAPVLSEVKDRNPNFYVLGANESIKDVADRYNASVASILALNPGISPDRIVAGTKIKLPKKGSGLVTVSKVVETPVVENFDIYTAKSKDTWETIAEMNGIESEMLEKANPDVKNIKKKQVIAVPKIVTVTEQKEVTERDARETTPEGIRSIYQDVHKVSSPHELTKTVKVAILAESPEARKDTEFIRGFLTGLNRMKDSSYRIVLKVVNGAGNEASAVDSLKSFNPNLVFFTGDRNLPEYVKAYAESNMTPVVNTFDVKSEDYLHNPYIIQLFSPSSYFNECVASNAYSKFGDRLLVIIGKEDKGDQLATELVRLWDPRRIKYLPEGVGGPETFADNEKYLFYAYTVKRQEVETVLKDVASVKEELPFADIALLGRPNWVMFDEALASEFHRVNTYIPSRFYLDGNSPEAKEFYKAYRNLFNYMPSKSLPLYAAVGYDTSTYFIPAMGQASNDINLLRASSRTIQNEFDLKRVSNWGGLMNPPVYLVNFTPYDTIDKIVIQ